MLLNFTLIKLLSAHKTIHQFHIVSLNILKNCLSLLRSIVMVPQVQEDVPKIPMSLLHFLMMAPALLSFSRAKKDLHDFEDPLNPSEMFV